MAVSHENQAKDIDFHFSTYEAMPHGGVTGKSASTDVLDPASNTFGPPLAILNI
jgi:hypothetical protein